MQIKSAQIIPNLSPNNPAHDLVFRFSINRDKYLQGEKSPSSSGKKSTEEKVKDYLLTKY